MKTPWRPPDGPGSTRRTFLGQLGRLSVGLVLWPVAAGCEDHAFEPVIAGSDVPFLTPEDVFYRQFGANGAVEGWAGAPALDASTWTMALEGLVERPMDLSIGELYADPPDTVLATLRCIINSNAIPGLVGTATWTGVPLRVFLERAGVNPERARNLHVYGADGFTDKLALDKIYGARPEDLPEPMLVYEMNGRPLSPAHGAPVRLLVPGHFGFKSVKWISRIEVTDRDERFGSYPSVLGYDEDGRIPVNAKVTSHLRNDRVPPGLVQITGYALSGQAGIASVEVAVDEAPFRPARLLTLREILATNPDVQGCVQILQPERYGYPFPGVWVLWEYRWRATEGVHRLRIRASDTLGNMQPETDTNPKDGENPVFEIEVQVG
ncbi:MAG: hypothetical protein KatS3mg042_1087 [Rhodothermaceae bacterium]|nr:MAG: hypothetical protein KatS3mg042_1087 [Rhodothermaceae bacterium]